MVHQPIEPTFEISGGWRTLPFFRPSSSAADASGCRGAPHVESSSREGFHPAPFEERSSRPFEGRKTSWNMWVSQNGWFMMENPTENVDLNGGTLKWLVYNGKPIYNWMIWGYPHFRKPPCDYKHYCLWRMSFSCNYGRLPNDWRSSMGCHVVSLFVTHLRFVKIKYALNVKPLFPGVKYYFCLIESQWTVVILCSNCNLDMSPALGERRKWMCFVRDDAGDGKSEVFPELCSRECSQTKNGDPMLTLWGLGAWAVEHSGYTKKVTVTSCGVDS